MTVRDGGALTISDFNINLSLERQACGQDPNLVLSTPDSFLEFYRVVLRVALKKDGEVGPFKVMMEASSPEGIQTVGTSLHRRGLCEPGARPGTLDLT